MKKKINNTGKWMATAILLLIFNLSSYAQESLVNEQWKRRMNEISSELKNEWAESLRFHDFTKSRGIDLTPEDLSSHATYVPVAYFVLDYNSYRKLTAESNLEFLIQLDTMRVSYEVFNKRTNKYAVSAYGRFINGRWEESGFGVYSPQMPNLLSQLEAKNISVCALCVSYRSNSIYEYNIFIENGQLMCFRPDIPEPQPLLKTLLEFKEGKERQRRAAAAMGYYY